MFESYKVNYFLKMALGLQSLVAQKHQLESELKHLEKNIFDLETAYLEEPGNITNNWEVCVEPLIISTLF